MQKYYIPLLAGILCLLLIATGCTTTSPAPAATTVPTTATPVPPTPAVPSWEGTWNPTWLNTDGNLTVSVVTMTMAGDEVSGNYSYTYPDEGTYDGYLNGTVKGQTFTGMYAETDDDVGYIIFALCADGNSFTGRWVHAEYQTELDNSTLFWTGVRISP